MTFRSKLVAGLGIALGLLVLIGVLSLRSLTRAREDAEWVTHTHIVLEKLNDLHVAILDAETGQRGFLLTGDESYLPPYTNSRVPIEQDLADLRRLTSDNPVQQRNLDRLEPVVSAKFGELQERIEIRRRSGLDASAVSLLRTSGQTGLDRVRSVVGDMQQEENQLLAKRAVEADASTARSRQIIVVANACALLFLSLAGVVIRQEMARRRQAEDEIRQLNADLEQRVAERTAELAERNKDLARSNAELQQFAYVASHDLQEPLRMVASFTQLLAKRYKDKLDDEAREFIHFAVDGATRLQTLITDLLAFSRVGTHAKPLEEIACDSVLDRVLQSLKLAIIDSRAQITRDPLPTMMGDPVQVGQLFQNLLTNAMKFRRPDAPPRIHISAEQSGGLWKVRFRDNGIGIAAEHAERVFVIFQRLHTKAEYPGTGIGLAICKKIVERHGGSIWIEPSPGGGTTFCFTIPVMEKHASREESQNDFRIEVAAR